MAANDLSQLTAIIPARGDRKILNRLQRSLHRHYPSVRQVVAGEGLESKTKSDGNVLRLPTGAGRAAACNAMLARIRTPYFLLVDDRCEIGKDASLEQLQQLVASDKLDVAGGELVGCERMLWLFTRRRPQPTHGILELAGDQLTLRRGHRTVGEGYCWCDLVPDFYVARTDKIRSLGGWDPELKNDHREEFFLRAHRQGLRVGVNPEATARYWIDNRASKASDESPNMKTLAVAKMGLARMTDLDGRVAKAPRRARAA